MIILPISEYLSGLISFSTFFMSDRVSGYRLCWLPRCPSELSFAFPILTGRGWPEMVWMLPTLAFSLQPLPCPSYVPLWACLRWTMVQPSPWRPSFDFWRFRSPDCYLVANILGWMRVAQRGKAPISWKIHAPFRRIPSNLLISSTKLGRATTGKNYR